MPTLKVTSGPRAGHAVEFDQEVEIGREGSGLALDDSELSRRHAVVRVTADGVEIEDLGSLNGTFVDERRIEGRQSLSPGAAIRVGTTQLAVERAPAGATRLHAGPGPGDPTRIRPTPQRAAAGLPQAQDAPEASPTDKTRIRPSPGAATPVTRDEPAAPAEAPVPDGGGDDIVTRKSLLITVGVLAALAIVIVVVLTSIGGDEKTDVGVTINIAAPTPEDVQKATLVRPTPRDITFTMAGSATSKQFGPGSATATITRHPLEPRRPQGFSLRIVFRFDDGTITGRGRFTGMRAQGGLQVAGTVAVVGGTGDYEGASGTLGLKGVRPQVAVPVERITFTGAVDY